MLKALGEALDGKTCVVSGAGNVAIYAIEKLQQLGANVVACSDSTGYVYDQQGIDLDLLKEVKEVERGRIESYAARRGHVRFIPGGNIWEVPCQIALPCATQNELTGKDAVMLVNNGCIAVGEGANMPTTPEGVRTFLGASVAFGPGKAANAGGVATSALEMQQNASRDTWSFEYTEQKLAEIMKNIHRVCFETAEEYGTPGNYVNGANIAAFIKVANPMVALGLI
jgi:glutamate dehydrogenase (NADP+)